MSGGLTFFPGFSPSTDKGLFDHGASVIFNTVNTRGTSPQSRGVAGQVFRRYPDVHAAYMRSCTHEDPAKRLRAGMVLPVELNARTGRQEAGGGLWVMNAATKDNWRDPSKLEWVESITHKLGAIADRTGGGRFVIPPMGCGEGGLDWKRQVGPMMRPHLEALAQRGVQVFVFAEDPAPERGGAVSVRSEDNRKGGRVLDSQPPALLVPMRQTEDWYAGVGARPKSEKNPTGTPPSVEAKMRQIGQALAEEGWGLRSGGAAGADDAFEQGARQVPGAAMQIFLPSQRFNNRAIDGQVYLAPQSDAIEARAVNLARKLHPAGDRLSGFALNAMARNAFQVYGPDLDSTSKALVCYTDKGAEVGGTGHALRLAEVRGVPVINLGDPRWKEASVQQVVDAMGAAREGKAFEAPEAPLRRSRASRDDGAR